MGLIKKLFKTASSAISGDLAGTIEGAASLAKGKKKGGSSASATSTGSSSSTSTSAPLEAVQPYIFGDQGYLKEAQRLFQNQAYTQQQRDLDTAQFQNLNSRSNQLQITNALADQALHGVYDPNVQRVGNIQGAGQVSAERVDPQQAFRSLGAADPTRALSQILRGQVDTRTLDPVVNNALARISDNFNEQVLPGINQGAIDAGQYGGSRQGIAQGLALKGLSQTLGDTAAGFYNNAYQAAQQYRAGAANNLAGLGISNAQQNADRNLQAQTSNAANQLATQQFNANLGLQNNNQAFQQSAQQLANRQQGVGLLGQGNQLQDQIYSQQSGLLNAENQFNTNRLNNYAGLVNSAASLGGRTVTNTTSNMSSTPASASAGSLSSKVNDILSSGKQIYDFGKSTGIF